MSTTPILKRSIQNEVILSLKQFAFISITGPRQSGKTTLCHLAGNNYDYINFEDEEHAILATKDTKTFFKLYPNKVILDEVQKVPKLFNALMVHSDKQQKNGAFILSGSQNFLLMEKISQTLAGRVAVFTLLPLSLSEVFPILADKQKNWLTIAIRGFYPLLYKDQTIKTNLFYKSYIDTYVERDVRQLVNIHEARVFKHFLKICAIRAGNIVNFNEIATQIGTSISTVKRWISILETSYIIYLLPSYYNNLDKRIVKKPKLYFYDTGILCYLLNIVNEEQLILHAHKGAIFENLVITDLMKYYFNKGMSANAYFWQDSNGNEVDLLIENDGKLQLFEIKSSATPKLEFANNINKFESLIKDKNIKIVKHLLYAGSETYKIKTLHITSWMELANWK
jgi:uncharacterized protein